MSQEEIHDSPESWVAADIQKYLETDGRSGQNSQGVTTLLLTTRGRKSGLLRRTALINGMDGDHAIIVASNGGSDHAPLWYLNLVENPDVEVQIGADKFSAIAHTADAIERKKLWPLMASIFPNYDKYQASTKRVIPVVVLVRK